MRLCLFALCTVWVGCAPAPTVRATHGALVAETVRGQTRVSAANLDVTFAAPTVRRAGGSPVAAETWWTDVEGGLEQGWTLDDPGGDGVIRLAVPVSGGEPSVEQTGQGFVLRVHGPDGDLVGTGLASWDANHRPLEVTAVAVADGFELAVDVEGAAWPVTVDPVWYATEVGDMLGPYDTPYNLTIVDYDRDGVDDVVAGQRYAATVWFGGDDFPSRSSRISTSCGGGLAVVGQLDGDGWPDLLIDNCAGSAVGTWGPVELVDPLGRAVGSSFVLADVNGDGYDDALTVGAVFGVLIWAGGPDGPAAKPTAAFPTQLAQNGASTLVVGEVDGDSGTDIAVLTSVHGAVGGVETFTGVPGGFPGGTSVIVTSEDMGVTRLSGRLALGDIIPGHEREFVFRADVAGRPSVVVFDATFSAGFLPAHVWHLPDLGFGDLVVADADGDGVDDVVIRSSRYPGEAAFVFQGGPVLARQHSAVIRFNSEAPSYAGLAVGDLDGDDRPDLVSNIRSAGPGGWGVPATQATFTVHLGRADGPMSPINSSSTAPQLHRVARGTGVDMRDIDGDGVDDLLTWHRASVAGTGFVDLHLGHVTGISPVPDWTIGGLAFSGPTDRGLVVCDLDADGDQDLLVPTDGDGVAPASVVAWMFHPGAGFSEGISWTDPAWTGTVNVACGDLEPGAGPEVAIALPELWVPGQRLTGRVFLFRSDSVARYSEVAASSHSLRRFGASLAVADVDGDGSADLAVTAELSSDRDMSLWLGPSPDVASAADYYWTEVIPDGYGQGYMPFPMSEIREAPRGYGSFGLATFGNGRYPGSQFGRMSLVQLDEAWGRLIGRAGGYAAPGSFAFGRPAADGALWGVGAAAVSSADRRTSGLPAGQRLLGGSTWEAPEGVVADHADSLAMGDYNHDAYDDLLAASDGCEDPEGCVFLFVGSSGGLVTDPGADEDGDGATQIADCDDAEPRIYWGAVEVPMDGLDSDCDGLEICREDADRDGFGGEAFVLVRSRRCDLEGVNNDATATDCDDGDADWHPGAYEVMGIDTNCDGHVACYTDVDLDGYPATLAQVVGADCSGPGVGLVADDCDDTNPAAYPTAVEIPGDVVDEDCDRMEICFRDADGDGRADLAVEIAMERDVCTANFLLGSGPSDICYGDDSTGDPDQDGACSDVDTCPNLAGEDRDADGVCGGDRCLGDDAAGDTNRDGVCDDVSFRLVLNPVAYDATTVTGTVSRLPPRTTASVFLTWEGAGTSHCVAGVCLDIGLPPLRQTVQADAAGAANFSFRVSLNPGQEWAVQATVSRQGRVYKSNADIVRGDFLP